MIMDMLGIREVRNIITEDYQKSKKQIRIRDAIYVKSVFNNLVIILVLFANNIDHD